MTPKQARAARAMLDLDMAAVCALADVGKRTLTEFEAGKRSINNVTEGKLRAFYLSRGVSFPCIDGAVAVAHFDASQDHEPDLPRAKTEHDDVAGLSAIAVDVQSLLALIQRLEQTCAISRQIIIHVMRSRDLNQKQIAELLECSPAFVSAITRGDKRLPLSLIPRLKSLCPEVDVDLEALVHLEKQIDKGLAPLGAAFTDVLAVLDQLLHPT